LKTGYSQLEWLIINFNFPKFSAIFPSKWQATAAAQYEAGITKALRILVGIARCRVNDGVSGGK